jgi:hypothetical protein
LVGGSYEGFIDDKSVRKDDSEETTKEQQI